MTVGLLGIQGAFQDHIPHLQRCNMSYKVVRSAQDLNSIERLILPGGESTVMQKFLLQLKMIDPLAQRIAQGMPVWGICAGAILLAECVDGQPGPLKALPMSVTRNAYGRQRASCLGPVDIPLFHLVDYPALFIRAPRISSIGPQIDVLAWRGIDPVFVQRERIMATTFHPELSPEDLFHTHFLTL